MPELLLEILSEEIPARMQRGAAEQLKDRLLALFASEDVGFAKDVTADKIVTYATPRRLAAVVRDVPARQPDLTIEKRGPRVGAPDAAVQGFLKSAGVTLEQCEQRDTGKGVFWFANAQRTGRPTPEILATAIPAIIRAFDWPKSMRWASATQRWVRPFHSIICLFDGKVVAGAVELGGAEPPLAFGDTTRGHRFLAPAAMQVRDFADYQAKLKAAYVILDPAQRRQMIAEGATTVAAAEGLTIRRDEGLLDEVTGLVEWPVPLMGRIEQQFMDLPPEVLTTSMRAHQKYFALADAEGKMAPRFAVIANMATSDGGKVIIAGNERVLRARLSDARYFWDLDRKTPLEALLPQLDGIVFHAKLGTVAEKVARVTKLAMALARHVPGADATNVERAARLAKADLVTGMVGEFPELQGVMGRYYARHGSEHDEVADAIAEHYAPRGPDDRCPTAPVSVALALADKLDTLAGFFGIDEKPTGSKDPFALRRAALGAIRLILENRLRLPLDSAFRTALSTWPAGKLRAGDAVAGELLAFFADRVKVHLREAGVRHDLVAAQFGVVGGEDDLVRLQARVGALKNLVESDAGADLLTAYRRAANILRIEEKKDGKSYDRLADPKLLAEGEERQLFAAIGEVGQRCADLIGEEDFGGAMTAFARLRDPVDAFFDAVKVNAEDPAVRVNRLCLLSQIRQAMNAVADFSHIEG
jgi:glycyl-tRNA synthetase beta chain